MTVKIKSGIVDCRASEILASPGRPQWEKVKCKATKNIPQELISVEIHPRISFYSQIVCGKAYPLRCSFMKPPLEKLDRDEDWSKLDKKSKIRVVLDIDPNDFEIIQSNPEQTIENFLTEYLDQDEVFWWLKAKSCGKKTVGLRFYQDETYIGDVRIETQIFEHITESTPSTLTHKGEVGAVAFRNKEKPDVEIEVKMRGDILEYTVTMPELSEDIFKRNYEQKLIRSPQNFMDCIYEKLNDFSRSSYSDVEKYKNILRDIENYGMEFFEQLFPKELRQILWEYRDKIKTIFIISEEDWIPWEIIKLYNVDDKTQTDNFFGLKFVISRWIPHKAPKDKIQVKQGFIIAYGKKDELKCVLDEKKNIEVILKNKGIDLINIEEQTRLKICACFDTEIINLLHFAGDCEYDKKQPGNSSLIVEDHGLKVGDIRSFEKGKPMVFINACESSKTGQVLSGIGGFAKAFINAGSKIFIGTMWKIPDNLAMDFSKYFYKCVFEKDLSIGEALLETKVHMCKTTSNPAWLSYSMYGLPVTKVEIGKLN